MTKPPLLELKRIVVPYHYYILFIKDINGVYLLFFYLPKILILAPFFRFALITKKGKTFCLTL